MNIFNIERAHKRRTEKDYDTTYWCIDLHDCIFRGDYKANSEGGELYPNAERVLKQLTIRKDYVVILYTAATDKGVQAAINRLARLGIKFDYINENPACESTDMCDFSRKFYFDILLDDKAGFVGDTDWFMVEAELKRIKHWFQPETPYVAADMIIERDDKIALIKRKFPPLGYAIPGGFQDIGERVANTAIREAKEETNMDVTDPTFLYYKDDPERDPRFHVDTFIFYGKGEGEAVAGDDAEELIWRTPDEIIAGDVELAFSEGIKETMRFYKKRKDEERFISACELAGYYKNT